MNRHIRGDPGGALGRWRVFGQDVVEHGHAAEEPLGDHIELLLGVRFVTAHGHEHALLERVELGLPVAVPIGAPEGEREPIEMRRDAEDTQATGLERGAGIIGIRAQAVDHRARRVGRLHLQIGETGAH